MPSAMMFYAVVAIGALLAALYVMMATGRLDELSAAHLHRIRYAVTLLLITVGVWGALMGVFLLLFICLLLAIPLARHLLDPNRDRLPAERAGNTITRDEALRVLELDEDELGPAAVANAYARLLALIPEARRPRSFYARRLQLARDYFGDSFKTD